MDAFLFQTLNGLTLISVLFLVAIGLVVTFGLMGVINLAHGSFFMLGAYAALVAAEAGLPVVLGLVAAIIVVALIGAGVEETVIRHLYRRPLDTLLATWGLSLVFRQTVQLVFGARQRGAEALFTGTVSVIGVDYPLYRLFIMGTAVAVAITFFAVIYRSDFGVQLRAVISNRSMAESLGINTRNIDRSAFGLGAAAAGLAGAIIAPLISINPQMGLSWLINAFLVVIVGGPGTVGAIAGAAFIGGAESSLAYFLKPVVASVLVLVGTVVVIRFRPEGLAGRQRP